MLGFIQFLNFRIYKYICIYNEINFFNMLKIKYSSTGIRNYYFESTINDKIIDQLLRFLSMIKKYILK
jgi:hypothetical protein